MAHAPGTVLLLNVPTEEDQVNLSPVLVKESAGGSTKVVDIEGNAVELDDGTIASDYIAAGEQVSIFTKLKYWGEG